MATVNITPDRDAVISEIEIAAPPERVFQALIDREQALQWGKGDAFEITQWEMDARAGGKWRFVSRERKAAAQFFDHHGEILENRSTTPAGVHLVRQLARESCASHGGSLGAFADEDRNPR